MITIYTYHDNERGIYKQDRELKLHKNQTVQNDGQFTVCNSFEISFHIFFKFNVRRMGLDAYIISFCENFKICDYVQFSKKSIVTSIMYQFSVETTLLAMMPLLPMWVSVPVANEPPVDSAPLSSSLTLSRGAQFC